MLKTPLYDVHVALGARIVDFAGWQMPLLYTSIVDEHLYTRSEASFFDISHMGRLELRGDQAEALLERVCTRRLSDAQVGQSRYSHLCNESGGILDDIIVSRYANHWMVVCNASNREKVVGWLQAKAAETGLADVKLDDRTTATMMIAIQGPKAATEAAAKAPVDLSGLKRYRFLSGNFLFVPYTAFRSGYTGEDGFEIILPASLGSLAGTITGKDQPIRPAGLGARDTLRLEAAMPLYGHELTEQTDSISAGLAWCVDLNKDFIGAEVLRKVAQDGPARKLVGLELAGKRIARQHGGVFRGDEPVGEVTSGTFGPTVQRSIAMAYVDAAHADPGTSLSVEVGSSRADAIIVKLPFYSLKK